MKTTRDTLTGKAFRWNDVVVYGGYTVPARTTKTKSTHLHPDRVEPKLLASLNAPRRCAIGWQGGRKGCTLQAGHAGRCNDL